MDSKSTSLKKRRRVRLSPLDFTSSPTSEMPERSSEMQQSSLRSVEFRTPFRSANFKISPNCGPYTNLEEVLKTRSRDHQARIKNASIRMAINLIYKYNARSISEVYNLCTSDEWAALIYATSNYNKDLQIGLDLFIKDSLELQRRDRWEWLISKQKFLPTQEHEILNILCGNNIDPQYFAECVREVFLCDPASKKNCIKLYGLPNSGKSLIGQLLCENFICSYNSNHGSEQPFFFSNFLNKSIVLCEELFVTPATIEDYKSILGGACIDIDKKYNEKQLLCRTPIIITSNHKLFGRGHLHHVDEAALNTRCYCFEFSYEYKPSCTVTAAAMAHLLHYLYNKDVL